MTPRSAFRTSIALALSAAAGIAVGQTTIDATTPDSSVSPPAQVVVPAPMYPQAGAIVDTTAPHPMRYNPSSACAGLADRQTERSCKEGFRTGPDNLNPSLKGNDSGNVDDQAG